MYCRYCKTLSVFERKIPLTFSLEFRFHQEFFPPISLLNILCLDPCQWSLMSLITGNKVKKKNTSQGIVKKKRTKPTSPGGGSS
jgi:hypothetical protein